MPTLSTLTAARVAAATSLYFLLVIAMVTWLRADLDPLRVPLSIYLMGPYSVWLQLAYFAHAAGLGCFAWSVYRTTRPSGMAWASAMLFGMAGLGLAPVVLTQLVDPSSPWVDVAKRVHLICAFGLLLCLTVAIALQTWQWRRGPLSRSLSAIGLRSVLAVAVVMATVLNLVRLPQLPGGMMQKTLIGLALIWTFVAAVQIVRARRQKTASGQGVTDMLSI